MGENIRLIDSVVNYTAIKNIPGLLLFLDFERAFDTLEWSFIQKNLFLSDLALPLSNRLKPFITTLKAVL